VLKSIVSLLIQLWPSILCMVAAAAGAVLSFGMLGLLLYYIVSPALNLGFPPLAQWDQSVVWPLIIGAPILWSPSFLPAGLLDRGLRNRGWSRSRRVPAYLLVLWLAGLASWWFVLAVNPVAWAPR
jgi:hypothetical protein